VHAYLDKTPRTPVTIRRSSILFLFPHFSNINLVEKGFIPVASTFVQVIEESYALIKASWIDKLEISFYIHGFMISNNLPRIKNSIVSQLASAKRQLSEVQGVVRVTDKPEIQHPLEIWLAH
jgi:hypothetical protein